MNKLRLLGITASLLLTGAIVVVHADESTATRVVDDSAITTKVKSALLGEKDVSSMKIHVKTYKGEVQLNGHVDTADQKAAAEAAASKVDGVTSVKNNLVVGKTHHTVGAMIDDSAITTKVKADFVGSDTVKESQISVRTHHGVVTLSGFAGSQAAKDEAESIASKVKGVVSVKNNIEVRQ